MKRIFLLIACTGALFLAACGGDSKLPKPTGKGAVRAINAIPGAPEVAFKIEEIPLGALRYTQSSGPVRYDDFQYSFNFDIFYPGGTALTRVASHPLKVEADRDHILLMTGDINAPTITVWNGDIREWEGSETVFEARFSHASVSLDDVEIDVYLDEVGTVPGTNPPVATLSYGEIVDAADFAAANYVLTVTTAGDIDTVHFVSDEIFILAQFAHVMTVFDGDGNDTAPMVVRSMTSVGNPMFLTDPRYPPKTRFIHSAYTLETVDVYDDELLTNLVVPGVQFKDATADLDTTSVAKTYYFTPANSQATILFDRAVSSQAPGTFGHIYLLGDTDAWGGVPLVPDRASSSISVKLRIFHAALNYARFDVYLKNRDEPIDEEDLPLIIAAAYSFPSSLVQIVAGSYDIYLTEQGNKTEISAPLQIDVALGDIVDLLAVDTMDPLVIEIINVPVP